MNPLSLSLAYLKRWGIVLPLLGALSAGFLAPGILELVTRLGHNIPQENISWDYMLGLFWGICLTMTIFLWPVPKSDERAVFIAWMIKLLVSLGFMLLFENHYRGLDSYGYFQSGLKTLDDLYYRPDDGSSNLKDFITIISSLIPYSFHALKVTFSYIGLISIYIFYRVSVVFMGRENLKIFYAILLFPSILFWSSGIGKDPITLFALSLYVYGVISFYKSGESTMVTPAILGGLIVLLIRPHLGLLLVLPLSVFFVFAKINLRFKITAILFFSFSFVYLADKLLHLRNTTEFFNKVNDMLYGWNVGSTTVDTYMKFDSFRDLFMFVPYGALSALFRPLPGEIDNMFGMMAGIENVLLISLILYAIYKASLEDYKNKLVIWGLAYVLTWALFFCFVLNFGALARFKLQMLPVFLIVLFYLARRRESGNETGMVESLLKSALGKFKTAASFIADRLRNRIRPAG